MARLYVDEDLGSLVEPLRNAGHDVIFAVVAGGQGKTDTWHFREALLDQRVLVTFNVRDFRYLHRLWTTLKILNVVEAGHAGILTKEAPRVYTPADWLPIVQQRLQTQDDLVGRMYIWHPHTGRWEEDDWKPEE